MMLVNGSMSDKPRPFLAEDPPTRRHLLRMDRGVRYVTHGAEIHNLNYS